MASGKKRQTFEKMNRERRVREKRALKAEKREQRKLEANLVAQDPGAVGDEVVEPALDDSPAEETA
jgi:hypothetical protein